MKVTETRLDTLIDNLNTLICEDDLLTRQERETPVSYTHLDVYKRQKIAEIPFVIRIHNSSS